MDDRMLAALAEDNMVAAIECWTRAAGGEVHDVEGIHVVTAPVPMRSFNQMVVRRAVSDAALEKALGHFRGTDRFRMRFLPETGLTPERLAKAGLVRRGEIPSMALESPARQEIAGLDVRLVEDTAGLDGHVKLVADAFDWDSPDLASALTPKLLEESSVYSWVGYIDGKPVTTSQLVVAGEVGGIYWVATAEEERGKGLGGLITRVAVDKAAEQGCRVVSLQASPLGRPVYERLGFRVVAEYETYVAG